MDLGLRMVVKSLVFMKQNTKIIPYPKRKLDPGSLFESRETNTTPTGKSLTKRLTNCHHHYHYPYHHHHHYFPDIVIIIMILLPKFWLIKKRIQVWKGIREHMATGPSLYFVTLIFCTEYWMHNETTDDRSTELINPYQNGSET